MKIDLYGIGVMRKRLFDNPEFERKLSQCSNIDEVRQLIKQNPDTNQNLVKESCGDTAKLIRNVVEPLSLKNNQIKTFNAITDEAVDDIFTEIQLDNYPLKKK